MTDKPKPTHVIVPGSYRRPPASAVRVADVDPTKEMELIVDLAPRRQLPQGQVDKTWTPEELQKSFAPDPDVVKKVEKVLGRYNLKVIHQPGLTPSLYVKGFAPDVERAFQPGLAIYREAGRRAYIGRREGSYSIPNELQGLVRGVQGLDNRRVFKRVPRRRLKLAEQADVQSKPWPPKQVAENYKFVPGDGAGQKIGIAEFGGAVFQDDLDNFCKGLGLNQVKPEIKCVGGMTEQPKDLDTSVEVNMDVQIIAGLCPAAPITVYFAEFTQAGFVRLLDTVIADRPVVLSLSYGASEDDRSTWSAAALSAINDRLNAARLVGITICVSSGDDGTGCDMFDGGVHVEFPSSSPYVLAVGGTEIDPKGGAEVTWWDYPGTRFEADSGGNQTGGGSPGGGVSDRFARPDWQAMMKITSLNPVAISGRIVPDVAALAGRPGTACLLRYLDNDGIVQTAWQPGEGTSAAAPIWAALIARINAQMPDAKKQRFIAPLLYQVVSAGGGKRQVGSAGCLAIASGNNISLPDPGIGYEAKGSYSAVTGWGIPNGTGLFEVLKSI